MARRKPPLTQAQQAAESRLRGHRRRFLKRNFPERRRVQLSVKEAHRLSTDKLFNDPTGIKVKVIRLETHRLSVLVEDQFGQRRLFDVADFAGCPSGEF